MEKKKTVVVYESFYDAIQLLSSDEAKMELFNGMMNYGLYGDEPEFKTAELKLTWTLYKPNMDYSIKRYNKAVIDGSKSSGNKIPKKQIAKINLDTPKEASNEVKFKSEVIVPKEAKKVITNQRDIEQEIAEIEAEEEVDTTPSFSTKNFLKTKLISYVKERELLEANEEQLINYIENDKITSLVEINETIDNMFNKGK
jgi:hypothetical protein